jgi:hypothetical protein
VQISASQGCNGPVSKSAMLSMAPWEAVVWVIPTRENRAAPVRCRRQPSPAISGPGSIRQPVSATRCNSASGTASSAMVAPRSLACAWKASASAGRGTSATSRSKPEWRTMPRRKPSPAAWRPISRGREVS